MEKISILGFGNPVREDDGVGIYVVQELQKRISAPNIEILDMGTSAFEVLFQLKGRDKIILIDAVINSGEEVGTLFKLPATEIEAHIQDDPLVFLHSLKWDQALNYAQRLFPNEDVLSKIEVYLVAIHSTRFDTQMTPQAKEAGDRLIDMIMKELTVIS
ncbi:MAG: hydrogenase maturation protease [Bacteroidia bacterium]|nr:hydrogenase maturation protease [Bacteroidia bacterium]